MGPYGGGEPAGRGSNSQNVHNHDHWEQAEVYPTPQSLLELETVLARHGGDDGRRLETAPLGLGRGLGLVLYVAGAVLMMQRRGLFHNRRLPVDHGVPVCLSRFYRTDEKYPKENGLVGRPAGVLQIPDELGSLRRGGGVLSCGMIWNEQGSRDVALTKHTTETKLF